METEGVSLCICLRGSVALYVLKGRILGNVRDDPEIFVGRGFSLDLELTTLRGFSR